VDQATLVGLNDVESPITQQGFLNRDEVVVKEPSQGTLDSPAADSKFFGELTIPPVAGMRTKAAEIPVEPEVVVGEDLVRDV
jgi:hypothetical protein